MGCLTQIDSTPERSVPTLRANFTWTFAGSFLYALCQWGMISVLAKAGSAATVGKFALGLAVSAPVFMFANLQLRSVQATDALGEYPFGAYFTLRLVTTLAGVIAITGLVFVLRYDSETRNMVLLLALSKAIECMSDIFAGLLQWHERLDQVARSLMMRGLLSLAAFGTSFLLTRSLTAASGWMCAAWLAVLLGYDLRMARRVLGPGRRFLHFDLGLGWKLLVLSLPLGIVMTLNSLNTNIPRYILEHEAGPASLGIFSSLAYVMVAFNLLIFALCQSALTRLAVLFASNQIQPFLKLINRLSLLGVAIIAAGIPLSILCGRWVLTLLYQAQYGEHVTTLCLLVAATGVGAIAFFLTAGLNAARCFLPQVPVYVASTVVITLTCWWTAPRYQMNGAAFSLLLGSIVWLAGSVWILRTLVAAMGRAAAPAKEYAR